MVLPNSEIHQKTINVYQILRMLSDCGKNETAGNVMFSVLGFYPLVNTVVTIIIVGLDLSDG